MDSKKMEKAPFDERNERFADYLARTLKVWPEGVTEMRHSAISVMREEWEALRQQVPQDEVPQGAILLPREIHVGDKRIPFNNPRIHDGFVAGWNAYREEMEKLGPLQAQSSAEIVRLRKAWAAVLESAENLNTECLDVRNKLRSLPSYIAVLDQYQAEDGKFVRLDDVLGAIGACQGSKDTSELQAWEDAALLKLAEVLGYSSDMNCITTLANTACVRINRLNLQISEDASLLHMLYLEKNVTEEACRRVEQILNRNILATAENKS